MKTAYTLRLPEELRKKIKGEAERHVHKPVHSLTLTKVLSYKEATAALKERIQKAPSRADALKLLESIVPDIPPFDEDQIIPASD